MATKKLPSLKLVLTALLALLLAASIWFVYDNHVDRSGWLQRDGLYYYKDFHARRVTGWQIIDGATYYFGEDKSMQTGFQTLDGSTYYFGPDGILRTGWLDIDGSRYYADEAGVIRTGWVNVGPQRFCLGADGILLTGWQEMEGRRYYFGKDGAMHSGWLEEGGKRYYFGETGAMAVGWIRLDQGLYYFDEAGQPLTGEVTLEGNTYLFQTDGLMYTGWEENGEHRRFFRQDGSLATGWEEIDGKRYYFTEEGVMHTGWLTLGENRYYLQEDGSAAVGPTKIGYYTYYFSPAGIHVVLVNSTHEVPYDYKLDLVVYEGWHEVQRVCLEPLQQMLADCVNAGYGFVFNSGYRSRKVQEDILTARTKEFENEGYTERDAYIQARKTVALPGTSEHHLGLAVDLLNEEDAEMKALDWLGEHCWEYGFILRYAEEKAHLTGIAYEPWHFRYVGKEVAMDMKGSGLCLEEYLGAVPIENMAKG